MFHPRFSHPSAHVTAAVASIAALGMLLAGCRDFDIDPARSAMVGDRLSDIAAGQAAGCRACYLVKTGYGAEVLRNEDVSGIEVAEDLEDAVNRFLKLEQDAE